ncbi:MAG: DNA alkylation repair protein [Tannerellaceae bacterium]|jgi:3-methyladenine DNA glycosylase AlkD|nr:DNA alkylation repair protein [Tannerellaceae bacterium]
MTASQLLCTLEALANPEKASLASRYFKTGVGQYAEGDHFLGITVPQLRRLVKDFRILPLSELQQLLSNEYHDARFCALIILVEQFKKASPEEQTLIYEFYLANRRYVNNWDLVDLSAPYIVGEYLVDKDRSVVKHLAFHGTLWEQRIGILATLAFIRRQEYEELFEIIDHIVKVGRSHDLIQKALGWMLREVGKKDMAVLTKYLTLHAPHLPRTTLRYAIEHYPPSQRRAFLTLLSKEKLSNEINQVYSYVYNV